MNNIHLFTGEESYLVDQELKRWKGAFIQKFGSDSVFSYGPENFNPGAIMENVLGGGLFVSKKMLIIKHVPLDTHYKLNRSAIDPFTESFMAKIGNISPDTIIVFVSYKPDKRSRFYKFLQSNSQIKDFKKNNNNQLKGFIKTTLSPVSISDEMMDYMLSAIGDNMYRIHNESYKLKIRAENKSITHLEKKHIDDLIFAQVQANAFNIFDDIFQNADHCIQLIDDMKESGVDRNQALGTLYRGITMFILTIELYKKDVKDPKIIGKTIGYHYFPIMKQMPRIKQLISHQEDIKHIYQELVKIDLDIKTGKQASEMFRLKAKLLMHQYGRGRKSY